MTEDPAKSKSQQRSGPDGGPEGTEAKPKMVGHIPAASPLFGPHPHEGEEDASGSPEADREREEAEKRGEDAK